MKEPLAPCITWLPGCQSRPYLPRQVKGLTRVLAAATLALAFSSDVRPVFGTPLTGTLIGASGSQGGDPTVTMAAAMDGNRNTFFDAAQPEGAWVGLDLGRDKVIRRVCYCPRRGYAVRMVNGRFQGANLPDFSNAADLFVVSNAPPEGAMTVQMVSNTNSFRYVRYQSPAGAYGNVSEVEFYGHEAFEPDPFLSASGIDLRNQRGRGEVVPLRGVNLGSWLLWESWMCPMDASGLKDDWSVRDTLTRRFGAATKDSLVAAYEDTWVQEADLDNIAALGMNVIRLPFWYLNVQEEDGLWRADAFERMDWLVARAWQRGIYTILDLHGAPGGQSANADTTGRLWPTAQLWTNPAYQDRMVNIWERMAAHFRGNPAVAGYDLLNEPGGAPSTTAMWNLMDRCYKAIRAVDPDHCTIIEGTFRSWNWNMLPSPSSKGWTNVLYQMHAYGWGNTGDLATQLAQTTGQINDFNNHKSWATPCLIGEFNLFGLEAAWQDAAQRYSSNGMSWCTWSYKAIHGGGSDSWGVYDPKNPWPAKPNIQTDSASAIITKWLQWDTPGHFAYNPMLRRTLAMPVAKNDYYNVSADQTLVVAAPGVLGNDTHLNPSGAGIRLQARKISQPAHGSVVLNLDGSFAYTPSHGYSGPDSFRYKVWDGRIDSVRLATVLLLVGTNQPPAAAPTGLAAGPGQTQVRLNWKAAPAATCYHVKRSMLSGGPYSAIASGLVGAAYTDTSVAIGTTYYYVVSAANSAGESPNSTEVSAGATGGTKVFVSNSNFETPVVATHQYSPSGASWTFTGSPPSGAGIAANHSEFTAGNPRAPLGAQVAFLQGTGGFSQNLLGFRDAVTYAVIFSAAQRANSNAAAQTFDVRLDGTVIDSFAPSPWETDYVVCSTRLFTTTAGSHALAFAGVNLQGGDNTILIDNVRVVALPPPRLGLTLTDHQLSLSWPGWAAGFTAYRATQLAAPADWQPLTNAPQSINGILYLTGPRTDGDQQFYRLGLP
jgi:aryl-phospho-beta-D-glucosidase BglC (GH1 family)